MNHGSLFSGVGGFDLAAQWMGWNSVFHCEWNESCRSVLKHHWPDAKSFNDITQSDFTPYANRIDIISGGFPCQPFSAAGKRKGQSDDRYLWPEMLRAIREVRPRYVVAENVYGLLTIDRGYTVEVVCSDLENCGYERPVVFDSTSDAFGLSTLERHIWIITKTTDERRERGLPDTHQDQRDTEREFQGGNQRVGVRWDISESEFQRVDQRVSARLDKASKQRLIQMGNAIPPQVAYQIFKAIEQYEAQN